MLIHGGEEQKLVLLAGSGPRAGEELCHSKLDSGRVEKEVSGWIPTTFFVYKNSPPTKRRLGTPSR